MKEKCGRCGKKFEISQLTTARNEKGEKPKSSKAKKYCVDCEQQVYEREVLKDIFDQTFMNLGYYKKKDKGARNRYMGLISTLISRLENDSYTITQIRLILNYMINQKGIRFDENILLLVPYHLKEVSDYHNDLYRISISKSYGYIPPSK